MDADGKQGHEVNKISLLIVLLAGCAETTPNPAMVALQGACNEGDTRACAEILAVQQRGQALAQASQAEMMRNRVPMQSSYTYQIPTNQTRQTTCTPGYNGLGMNCTTY